MPDGMVAEPIVVAENERATLRERLSWFVRKREGRLTIWIMVVAFILVGIMVWHSFSEPILNGSEAKITFLTATSLLVLPMMLLLLDRHDNFTRGPKPVLPTISTAILIFLAALTFYDRSIGGSIFGEHALENVTIQNKLNLLALSSFFMVAFIPLIWSAWDYSIYENRKSKNEQQISTDEPKKNELDENAEAMGALVATLIVIGIGGLAVVAGETGSSLKFANIFGLILCGLVIGVFAIVVFLDIISEAPPIRALSRALRWLSRHMRWLSTFYKFVDSGFVRIGAGVAGMNQQSGIRRYLILSAVLISLLVMGWNLPAPLGLLPVLIAFLLAISVSRLWSWVEEDRSLAAMTDYKVNAPYRIGFDEDYRDETLLGFIFVFLMVPIAMMQAHEGKLFADSLFNNTQNKSFLNWFGFFGVELAKAIPIVDWAEIYNIQPDNSLISMSSQSASRHTVFLARVMVDLVLIAALIQAVSIAGRNRQQKRLYSSGHINRLDEIVEKRELKRATLATILIPWDSVPENISKEKAAKLFDLQKLRLSHLVDFRKYNKQRIFHISAWNESRQVRAFSKAIAFHRGIPLRYAIEAAYEIAESPGKNEIDLFRAYDQAIREHEDGSKIIVLDDLYRILVATRPDQGLRDFKAAIMDKMLEVGPPEEAMDRLLGIALGETADRFQYARDHASDVIVKLAGQTKDRNAISTAIEEFQRTRKSKVMHPQERVRTRTIIKLKERLSELS